MAYTQKQMEMLVNELNDPNTVMICSKHLYTPSKRKFPTQGCRDCHLAYWIHWLRIIPPDQRREKLEELQMLAHHLVELEQSGKWDIELYPHPVVRVEKDAHPDA